MRAPLVALAAALVLAGCMSGGSPKTVSPTPTSPSDPTLAAATPTAATGAAANDTNATAAAPAKPKVVTTFINGTVTGGGMSTDSLCCADLVLQGDHVDNTFDVGPGATQVLATLTWADATQDLDILLAGPDYQQNTPPTLNGTTVEGSSGHSWYNVAGTPGSGDSPAKLTVADLKDPKLVGKWDVSVGCKDCAQEAFQLVVQVTYAATAK